MKSLLPLDNWICKPNGLEEGDPAEKKHTQSRSSKILDIKGR